MNTARKKSTKLVCVCEFETCHTTLTLDAVAYENGKERGLRVWDEYEKKGTDMVIPEEIAIALEKAIVKWQNKQAK